MDLTTRVDQIMTPDPITVAPVDNMMKVERLFEDHGFHHLPVVDEGRLVGIISKSDYLFFRHKTHSYLDTQRENFRLEHFLVGDLMTTGLAKMDPDDSVDAALDVFERNILHAILIVEGGTKLRGILTPFDIIKFLIKRGE